MKSKKFYLETFGCQMNVNDSERVASLLGGMGFQASQTPTEADLVLLNTCSVREKAASKVYSRVGELKRVAKQAEVLFGVIGCVAQDQAEAIFRRCQAVRLVLGPRSIGRLPKLLAQLEQGFPRAIDVSQDLPSDFAPATVGERISRLTGYVSIIEGCNKNCSFCIVPYTRGRENSRSPAAILSEINDLVNHGYREICLLGQNVNSYRYVNGKHEVDFANLLRLVAMRFPATRFKYTTSYPRDFTPAIVNVMVEFENLANWVHLPAQSGSNRVLKRMYRQYSREQYLEKIALLRNCGREMSLTGDIIVGFPGETEADFQQTLSLLDEVEYDGLYSFIYSPRPHTVAAFFPDDLPKAEKEARLQELQQRQAALQRRRFTRYLGRALEVLVEGRSAHRTELTGHSPCHRVVNFKGADSLVGKMVKVKITKTNANSLFGEIV